MSKPMELPAEGEVVLGFWGDDDCMVTWLDGGKWMIQGYKRPTPNPPDLWVPLSLARKAREMEAALQSVADEINEIGERTDDNEDADEGDVTVEMDLTTLRGWMDTLDTALHDAGMGGGE